MLATQRAKNEQKPKSTTKPKRNRHAHKRIARTHAEKIGMQKIYFDSDKNDRLSPAVLSSALTFSFSPSPVAHNSMSVASFFSPQQARRKPAEITPLSASLAFVSTPNLASTLKVKTPKPKSSSTNGSGSSKKVTPVNSSDKLHVATVPMKKKASPLLSDKTNNSNTSHNSSSSNDTARFYSYPPLRGERSLVRPPQSFYAKRSYERTGYPPPPQPWLTSYQKAIARAPSRPVNLLLPSYKAILLDKMGPVKYGLFIRSNVKTEERREAVEEAEKYLNALDAQSALTRYQRKLISLAKRARVLALPPVGEPLPKELQARGAEYEIFPYNTGMEDELHMDLPPCLPWDAEDPEATPEWSVWDYMNTSPATHSPLCIAAYQLNPHPGQPRLPDNCVKPDMEDEQTFLNAGFTFGIGE